MDPGTHRYTSFELSVGWRQNLRRHDGVLPQLCWANVPSIFSTNFDVLQRDRSSDSFLDSSSRFHGPLVRNVEGGEIPSARFRSPSLHCARQVLVIWPTSQFGPWPSAKKKKTWSPDGSKNEGSLFDRIAHQCGGLTQHQWEAKDMFFLIGFLPASGSVEENSDQCIDVDHPYWERCKQLKRVSHLFPGAKTFSCGVVPEWNCFLPYVMDFWHLVNWVFFLVTTTSHNRPKGHTTSNNFTCTWSAELMDVNLRLCGGTNVTARGWNKNVPARRQTFLHQVKRSTAVDSVHPVIFWIDIPLMSLLLWQEPRLRRSSYWSDLCKDLWSCGTLWEMSAECAHSCWYSVTYLLHTRKTGNSENNRAITHPPRLHV